MRKFFAIVFLQILIFTGCSFKNDKIIVTNQCKIGNFYELDPKFSHKNQSVKLTNNQILNFLLQSIDKYENTRKGGDCTGFITVLNNENNGIFFDDKELNNHFSNRRKSQALYNYYKAKNRISMNNPKIGDLVFWQNTTRGIKNKKTGAITHAGVIREIYSDGRIRFVHFTSGRNRSDFMDLKNPKVHKIGKKTVNSYVARCKRKNFCLASNLFAGFGKVTE